MRNRQQISAELRGISPFMAAMEHSNPMTVPVGYFNALPQVIAEKIRLTDRLLPGLQNSNAYQVPLGYFEGLSDTILSSIKKTINLANDIRAEMENIAPLLNTISKEPLYSIPVGYFNQTNFISSVTKEKTTAKIVPLGIAKKWMQYAAAAIVAGVLVTGAFMFTDNKNYLEYAKYDQLDVPAELNKLSDEELVKYVNSPEQVGNNIPESSVLDAELIFDEKNNAIQQLSSEELDRYLKENAEPVASAGSKQNN